MFPRNNRQLGLFALFVLLGSARNSFADEPPTVSGAMVVDTIADSLRHYRAETNEERRRPRLWTLASTGDPRVALALGEVLASSDYPYPEIALLARFYLPETKRGSTDAVWDWWRENESVLRRKVKGMPR